MKGVSWKDARDPSCSRCACTPCQCDPHVAKRAEAQEAYDDRLETAAARARKREKKNQKKSAPKSRTTQSKTKFIKQLRKNNPSISDSDVKKALKKAGYSVGCGVVALVILSTPVGWVAYELAGMVWG